jgi:hypothetical protein
MCPSARELEPLQLVKRPEQAAFDSGLLPCEFREGVCASGFLHERTSNARVRRQGLLMAKLLHPYLMRRTLVEGKDTNLCPLHASEPPDTGHHSVHLGSSRAPPDRAQIVGQVRSSLGTSTCTACSC